MERFTVLLPDKFVKQLENIPESGLGFHVVNVTLKNGVRLFDRIVINGKELQLDPYDTGICGTDIKEITI
jgi:hypothetical protein